MSANFDLKELPKLKVTKASGPDGITARLLKDAAPVIAKPRLTWLTLLFQQDLFQLSGRMQEKHLFLNQEQGTMSIITN